MHKILLIPILFLSSYTFACSNLLDTDMRLLDSSETVNLCSYEDQVLLVVNVASRCGFTYQYEALQELYAKYQNDEFVILGFPSRDFMYQEYSDESKVKDFCSTEYGVTFPMFATSSVKGSDANSFYKSLTKITGHRPGWNFHKYLISKEGEVLSFDKNVEPDSKELTSQILKLL